MSLSRDCPPLRRLFLFLVALLSFPYAARALDFDAKLEPGVAIPLGSPQSDRFNVGGAATLKGLVGFEGGYVDIAAGLTYLGLPAASGYTLTSAGTAWAPSLGLRLQRPRRSEELLRAQPPEHEWFYGARPWLDADILYVRTGSLDRAGFAGAVGLSFPLDDGQAFWLGPFVRYFQILQQNHAGLDERDSKSLIVGLSLEVGTRLVRPTIAPSAAPQPEPAPVKECPAVVAQVAPPPPEVLPDRDGDGVPDKFDACPDVAGPVANGGCPVYEKIVIKPDRLELKEKIQFAWNTPAIDPISHPLLDEVTKALQDNKGFHVMVTGNASSEGGEAHNQTLSVARAKAVVEYIVKRGVARSRISFQGFGEDRPIESNATEAGREANRRVEFTVSLIIVKKEESAK